MTSLLSIFCQWRKSETQRRFRDNSRDACVSSCVSPLRSSPQTRDSYTTMLPFGVFQARAVASVADHHLQGGFLLKTTRRTAAMTADQEFTDQGSGGPATGVSMKLALPGFMDTQRDRSSAGRRRRTPAGMGAIPPVNMHLFVFLLNSSSPKPQLTQNACLRTNNYSHRIPCCSAGCTGRHRHAGRHLQGPLRRVHP